MARLFILVFVLLAAAPLNAQTTAPSSTTAAERRADEAFLRSDAVQAKLAVLGPGPYVAIWDGAEIDADPNLDVLLARIEKKSRDAKHRFTFKNGTQANSTEETTFPYEQAVGSAFMNAQKLWFSAGGADAWTAMRDNRTASFPCEKKLGGDTGGRMLLPMTVTTPTGSDKAVTRFLVATGYGGSVILPANRHFARFEVPGLTTITGIPEKPRIYRRCLTRLRIDELGLDLIEPALGERADLADEKPIVFAKTTWSVLNEATRRRMAIGKRHAIVLVSPSAAKREAVEAKFPADVVKALERFEPAVLGEFTNATFPGTAYGLSPADAWEEGDAQLIALYSMKGSPSEDLPWLTVARALVVGAKTTPAEIVAFFDKFLKEAAELDLVK